MIFVTVGTQLSFDRLIAAVDDWAGHHPEIEVVAQVGPTELQPRHMKFSSFLSPDKADNYFARASLIVSHAGMGSILTALKYQKPILIMPRRASLAEHRNEHQMATAKWFSNKPGITVAWETIDLAQKLDFRDGLSAGEEISDDASPELIVRLKSYFSSV